jgi:hypothetical protein
MTHKTKLWLIGIGIPVYIIGMMAFIIWRSMGGGA